MNERGYRHHVEGILLADYPGDLRFVRRYVSKGVNEATGEVSNPSLLILERWRIVPVQRYEREWSVATFESFINQCVAIGR